MNKHIIPSIFYACMDEYSETKRHYDTNVHWHERKSLSYSWERQIKIFISLLKGKKVLDVGCGTGRDSRVFLKAGLEVEGIDFSGKSIQVCRNELPGGRFIVQDLRYFRRKDDYYDGIWACASLLHLKKKHLLHVLKRFVKMLKTGGVMFISVKQGLGEKLLTDNCGKRFFSFYTVPELTKIVQKSGLKVVKTVLIKSKQIKKKSQSDTVWVCMYARKGNERIV